MNLNDTCIKLKDLTEWLSNEGYKHLSTYGDSKLDHCIVCVPNCIKGDDTAMYNMEFGYFIQYETCEKDILEAIQALGQGGEWSCTAIGVFKNGRNINLELKNTLFPKGNSFTNEYLDD